MGLTHGECHIYLTSLNPQLFKNIAYVGSFKHFSVQLFYMYFATRPRASLTEVHFIINSVIILVTSIITNIAIRNDQMFKYGKLVIKYGSPAKWCISHLGPYMVDNVKNPKTFKRELPCLLHGKWSSPLLSHSFGSEEKQV